MMELRTALHQCTHYKHKYSNSLKNFSFKTTYGEDSNVSAAFGDFEHRDYQPGILVNHQYFVGLRK